jgi:spore germination cell wall hydrolase CwlJ-like protein
VSRQEYYVSHFYNDLASRARWALAGWRRSARVHWFTLDKEPIIFAFTLAMLITAFVFAMRAVYAYQDERREFARQQHERHLSCLARNVYYEARGEPVAGQYAVAEVTMNRTASRRYADTVCGVVHQKNWDWIRGRFVGAFSWTEFDSLPEPSGEAWQRAQEVAEAVYYRRETPALDGATHFHARYVNPSWAKQKRQVAQIGKHVFYR